MQRTQSKRSSALGSQGTSRTNRHRCEGIITVLDREGSGRMRLLITVNADLDVTVEFRTGHIELAAIERVVGTVGQQQRVMRRNILGSMFLPLSATSIQILNIKGTAFVDRYLLELIVILPNRSIQTTVININFSKSRRIAILESDVRTIDHIKLQVLSLRSKIKRIHCAISYEPRSRDSTGEFNLAKDLRLSTKNHRSVSCISLNFNSRSFFTFSRDRAIVNESVVARIDQNAVAIKLTVPFLSNVTNGNCSVVYCQGSRNTTEFNASALF